MSKLEDLRPNASVRGILPNCLVTVVNAQWFGSEALELTYKDPAGKLAKELLYRHDESRLEIAAEGRPWSFDGDAHQFRLVSEAHRIRLAHLFDPVLSAHASVVEPLPASDHRGLRIDAAARALALPARRRSRRGKDDHGERSGAGEGLSIARTYETREPAFHPVGRAQPACARLLRPSDDPHAQPRPPRGERRALQRRLLQLANLCAVACLAVDRALRPSHPLLGQRDPVRRQRAELAPPLEAGRPRGHRDRQIAFQ